MASVLIRNLDDRTVRRLRERAARNGRSLQAELRSIIERAVMVNLVESRALAARIRRELGNRKHRDSTTLIAGDRRR